MEIVIPAIALGSLYLLSKRGGGAAPAEGFDNGLPNTNIPDKNYPDDRFDNPDTDATSSLSHNNKYKGGTYTDKYFNQPPPTADGARYLSATGKEVDSSYFQHNNMVPFFGGKQRSRHDAFNRNESILDNYVGTGSQDLQKQEQAPLFSPQTNLQYAYGAPNQTDYLQSRTYVSNNMAGVKPFEDIKVAPGVGLGYGSEGAAGFNSGMLARELWTEKTVDELRPANKPKASEFLNLGHEGPATSYVKQIGDNSRIGVFEKNLPDTYFDMTPDRYFTTVGVEKGPQLVPIHIIKTENRPETSTEYTGVANPTTMRREYVVGEYRETHNQELGPTQLPAANRAGRGGATTNDYSRMGVRVYSNNRTVNTKNTSGGYFGNLGVAAITEAVVAPFLEVLRPSRAENTIGNLRPYQNAKTAVSNSYVYNPHDRPATTIKETTVNSKFHLNINMPNERGAYETTEYQPVDQNRDTTTVYYAGGSEAPAYLNKPRSREAEQNQRNNEVKEASLRGYTPGGNTNVFNNSVNARTNANREQVMLNRRDVVPALPVNPDYYTGTINTRSQSEDPTKTSTIQLNRNENYVLDQLKDNPFVLPIVPLGGNLRVSP
jgi:hypothetical protein